MSVIVVWLATVAGAYAVAAARLWRRSGRRALGYRHAVAFATGWAALAAALASPVERLAGTMLSAHMVQHVLLIAVAAPLIAYGAPLARMPAALPPAARGSAHALARRWRAVGVPAALVAAGLLATHVVVVWAWHVPGLYEAALAGEALHAVEHGTLGATALVLWWALLGFGARTRPSGATLLALFALGVQGAALGALMAFAAAPWYEPYAAGGSSWGGDPLADQQLAGLVMWGVGGIGPVVVGAAMLIGWIERLDRYPRSARPH